MFGISTLGWFHTVGSLPAIPLALYMFCRYGRIRPHTKTGIAYFISMLIGAATVFLVAHQSISHGIAILTIAFLLGGFSAAKLKFLGRSAAYVETVCLSITAFLLMVPSVSETLRRVPDGHPFVTNIRSPVLLGSQASLLALLVVGLTAQIIYLRRNRHAALKPRGH